MTSNGDTDFYGYIEYSICIESTDLDLPSLISLQLLSRGVHYQLPERERRYGEGVVEDGEVLTAADCQLKNVQVIMVKGLQIKKLTGKKRVRVIGSARETSVTRKLSLRAVMLGAVGVRQH